MEISEMSGGNCPVTLPSMHPQSM